MCHGLNWGLFPGIAKHKLKGATTPYLAPDQWAGELSQNDVSPRGKDDFPSPYCLLPYCYVVGNPIALIRSLSRQIAYRGPVRL